MSTTASRSITLGFTGVSSDSIEYSQVFNAIESSASPAVNNLFPLTTGNNTIEVPDDTVAVTIIPPIDNEETLTLKGVNADAGITLSMTDPTSLAVDSVASFVLNAGDDVTVRIIFS